MALVFVFFFLLSCFSLPFSAADDSTAFVYAGCSQTRYEPGSPYQLNADSLLTSLANAAASVSYANFTSAAASPSTPVYGLFQCRGDLPSSACQPCIRAALSQLAALCPSASAAALQLQGCLLRYSKDSFLGRPDTTLLYKKCGPSAGGTTAGAGPDVLGSRDAALGTLTGGPGGAFRVGAAGDVQAAAQCVGDLGAKECADCVADAAGQLKASCGFAVSGDVYLGKCYVRYWSNGDSSASKSNNNGDETGKTLAIIIGLLAGVALIIIFLSFIKRGGQGK